MAVLQAESPLDPRTSLPNFSLQRGTLSEGSNRVMRHVYPAERVQVGSLSELDALIGTHVTGERPIIRWENRQTQFVFGSVEEAIDALSDPYYSSFAPMATNAAAVLFEIKEYRRYSSDLNAAWDVVETVTSPEQPLQVAVEGERWVAVFGDGPGVVAPTAPVAICVAALRAKGVAVEFAPQLARLTPVLKE